MKHSWRRRLSRYCLHQTYVFMECRIVVHVPVYYVKVYYQIVYVAAVVGLTGQLVFCSYVV